MILSYHPCFVADRNIVCAGRQPDERDLEAIRSAAAVVLPQGCGEVLYRLARENCPHVFPNLDARFDYPGKIGQIRLFRKLCVRHPASWLYASLADYPNPHPATHRTGCSFPLVFKQDWGGDGEGVWLLHTEADLADALSRARAFEASGQQGFILQRFIACGNRALRVAVIGDKMAAYWRVQCDPSRFGTGLAKGGVIEHDADRHLVHKAVAAARQFCRQTGINLAGFDFLFAEDETDPEPDEPYFLEINYYFGRTGLGGSAVYYRLLAAQIRRWLKSVGLTVAKFR